jgi:diaminopimelate decarboxylase
MPDDADPVEWGEERAIADQREVLGSFGVRFDDLVQRDEPMSPAAPSTETLADLRDRGVVYEADGATWLRSSDYGDDKDRVLVKSDGEYTYLLPDIAYHRDKFSRSDRLINIWGADHHGYIARMKAAMAGARPRPRRARGRDHPDGRPAADGEPMKLSKRAGDIIELRDIVDEVGADAARFTYLLQSVDSRQTFDLAEVASRAWTTRSSTCRWRTPASGPSPARPPSRASSAARSPRSTSRCSATSASSTCCARCRPAARGGAIAARDRAPHRITTWVRELAGGRPRLLPRLLRHRRWRPARAHPGPALAGGVRPHRPRHRPRPARGLAPDRSAVSRPVPRHLLPDSAEVGTDGSCHRRLRRGRARRAFGTPLFVYDEAHLRARCREAVEAFGDGVAYATKAFLCRAMARLAHEEGMHLDVATGGELTVALAAGVPGERIVLHGNNKSDDELEAALDAGVGRIVVDSFDELDRLERLHAETGQVPPVLLRVTPGVEAHTHEFVATGQDDSKFGFTCRWAMPPAAVERATASPAVELVGIHAHIGSQVFRLDSFEQAVEAMAAVRAIRAGCPSCRSAAASASPTSRARRPRPSPSGAVVREACDAAGITARVTAEPGRAIAAAAGHHRLPGGHHQGAPGIRTYVSVDGGLSDNPRPVLYGSGYETFLPRRSTPSAPRWCGWWASTASPATCWCARPRVPEGLAVGDLLATPVTGAYGHSMGSNYNKVLRPAVVFVATARPAWWSDARPPTTSSPPTSADRRAQPHPQAPDRPAGRGAHP